MKQTEYEIPIFTDNDKADLNLYSSKMAEALRKQLDKFGNPLIFKGAVSTLTELENLKPSSSAGEIYRVNSESKNYIFDGTNFQEYSDDINIDLLESKSHKYQLKITAGVTAGTEVTIPCYFKVGQAVPDVYLNGERLLLSSDASGTDGHYQEVGTADSISNKIKTTTDWALEAGDVLDFVVRGDYSAT